MSLVVLWETEFEIAFYNIKSFAYFFNLIHLLYIFVYMHGRFNHPFLRASCGRSASACAEITFISYFKKLFREALLYFQKERGRGRTELDAAY